MSSTGSDAYPCPCGGHLLPAKQRGGPCPEAPSTSDAYERCERCYREAHDGRCVEHHCEKDDQYPLICKAALVSRAETAERLYRDDFSEPGSYWRRAWERRGEHLVRAYQQANKQQARADRLESALIKAEKRLSQLERWSPLPEDDSDPEGRASASAPSSPEVDRG